MFNYINKLIDIDSNYPSKVNDLQLLLSVNDGRGSEQASK